MSKNNTIIDGNELLSMDSFKFIEPYLIDLIAATSIWVDPKNISLTPIYPNIRRGRKKEHRGQVLYGIKIDDNTYANRAIKSAIAPDIKFNNFTVCHIWPQTTYNERYHTLLSNLVLIPSILASLSDYYTAVTNILQYRAYELYGWHPEGTEIPKRPTYYPKYWRPFIQKDSTQHPKHIQQSIPNNIQTKEEDEIDKILRKVPQWLEKPANINSKILTLYMELSNNGAIEITRECLQAHFEEISDRPFKSNYDQMKYFGDKNNAKIFDEDKYHTISLWEPTKVFVIEQYLKHKKLQ